MVPIAAASCSATLAQALGRARRACARSGSRRVAALAVERERRGEPGERELVGAQRAHQRVLARGLDRGARADRDAGLRPAEQLVAGERHEVGAGRDGLGAPSARRAAPSARWVARSMSAPEPRSIIVGDAARAAERDQLAERDLAR